MRTIKFRGRDVFTDAWRYGDLVHNQKVTRTGLEPRVMVGGYEVDKYSVGQFTGHNDIGGEEIYEGDTVIVSCGGGIIYGAVVVWNERTGAFLLDEGDCNLTPVPWGLVKRSGTIHEHRIALSAL